MMLAPKRRRRPMTEPIDLNAIRARADAATPGPWRHVGKNWIGTPVEIDVTEADWGSEGHTSFFVHTNEGGGAWRIEDVEFIANARTDVPALVAEVERLRRERDEALDAVRDAEDEIRWLQEMQGMMP